MTAKKTTTKGKRKAKAEAKSKIPQKQDIKDSNDAASEESKETTPDCAQIRARKETPKEQQADSLIQIVALNPEGLTFDQIAEAHGISRRALYDFRREHAEEIQRKRQEFYEEKNGRVARALMESIEGFVAKTPKGDYQHPPNPKSIELYLGLVKNTAQNDDSDPLRLYDEYWPLPKQSQFIFSGDPLGKFTKNYLISGIGFGKTAALIEKALVLARRNRKRLGMIVAPTYKMLQHPVLEYLINRLNQLGIKYKYRKADGELELWGDTIILLRSADNPDNLRGPTIAWAVGDELRNWEKSAFDIVLGRIRDPNARDKQFAGTTTPDGFNWIYEEVEGDKADSQKRDGQLSVIYAKTSENPHLPSDFIELVENTYSDDFAKQELEGKFLPVGKGLIYHCFNRSVNIKPCKYDPALPVWIGQDFNVTPMASVLMQPHRLPNGQTEVHVFAELVIRNASVDDLVKAWKELGFPPDYRGDLFIYPDATAWNRNVSAAKAPLTQIRDAGYKIVSPRGNPLTRDRYAAVNGKLKNAHGVSTLFIDPSCKTLITDFEREVYKEGSPVREGIRDGAATRGHHSDALGYPIHNEFRIETGFIPSRLA